jgi:hypothetical protein
MGTRQSLGNILEERTISFLGKEIAPVLSAKDLGLTLDNHLTYDIHISNVISSAMSMLYHQLCPEHAIWPLLQHPASL